MAKSIQYSFERYEKKYFLTPDMYTYLLKHIRPYMQADEYGLTSILNIYYDTDDWSLIRESIEKPAYKEKLRVRSYGVPKREQNVFIELKKKCKGIVYKRRITKNAQLSQEFLCSDLQNKPCGQIENEIKWFQNFHKSKPKVFIAYDRTAYAGIDDPNLRITFDKNLRWRDYDLDLCLGDYGEPIIKTDNILMEIKIPGACPLWLCRLLSQIGAFPTSFSKYGACYREHLMNKTTKEIKKEALLRA